MIKINETRKNNFNVWISWFVSIAIGTESEKENEQSIFKFKLAITRTIQPSDQLFKLWKQKERKHPRAQISSQMINKTQLISNVFGCFFPASNTYSLVLSFLDAFEWSQPVLLKKNHYKLINSISWRETYEKLLINHGIGAVLGKQNLM